MQLSVFVPSLRRVLALLRKFAPLSASGDLTWHGPYFIERGAWWPTRFVLYQDELYCTAQIGWSTPMLVWDRAKGTVSFRGQMSFSTGFRDGPELWSLILEQVERRLRSAATNVAAYNARVKRYVPAASRVGKIRRRLTWPKGTRAPLSRSAVTSVERALGQSSARPASTTLSADHYLALAGVAYDAAFPELRDLAPREKYARKADGRHGGMLDLPGTDPGAFEKWFDSRTWQGCHPWEIVFAHPHGIMFSPVHSDRGWRFYLSVDTRGLYAAAVKMALVLVGENAPLELARSEEILRALRGDDLVDIGPFYDQLRLDELEERRPGAGAWVAWEPLPVLRLASAMTSMGEHA